MGLRSKSRTRLVVLTVAVVGAVTVLGGGFMGLRWYRTEQAREGKPKGLAAYKQEEWVAALHLLGPYWRRFGDDVEVLAAYAKVREQLPQPGGWHLDDAAAAYRRLVVLQPENLDYKRALAKLYAARGRNTERNTELIQAAESVISRVADDLARAFPADAAGVSKALPGAVPGTVPATGESAGTPEERTAVGILLALRKGDRLTDEVQTKYVEALAEGMRLKILGLMRMRKMVDALALAKLLGQADPGPASVAMELQVMEVKGAGKAELLARMEQLTAGMTEDVELWILKAETYATCGEMEKAKGAVRTAQDAKFREELTKKDDTVLTLVDLLDRLEMFSDAGTVLETARTAHNSERLEEEHFRRLIYQEKFQTAAEELAKIDVTKRALLAGLRVVALNGWARELEAAGKGEEAATKKQEGRGLLKVLEECNNRWDFKAEGWLDVLTQAYYTDKPKDRDVIDACQEAVSREPNNAFFHMYLANAYQTSGDAPAALPQWNMAGQRAPSWSLPLVRKARFSAESGLPGDAYRLAVAADTRLPGRKETLEAMVMSWHGERVQPEMKSAGELLTFIAEHKDLLGMNEVVLPLEVELLLGQQAGSQKAVARVQEAVRGATKDNARVLLLVALRCHGKKNLEDSEKQCLETYEKWHGITPELATVKCRILLEDKGAAAAVKAEFESLRQQTGAAAESGKMEWDLAWCQLLEALKDGGAHDAWKALVQAHKDNALVQWAALAADSVRADHALSGGVLAQLKEVNGENGLSWRMEEARWLLEDRARDSKEQAVKLLTQTVGTAPENADVRKLLARAYLSTDNTGAAIAEFERAAELVPEDLDLKMNLAALYLQQPQPDTGRAVEQLKRVAVSGHVSATQKTRAGVLLAQAGETELAMTLLQSGGSSTQGREMLPQLYWQRGDRARARAGYMELLGIQEKDGKIVLVEGAAPSQEVVERALQFFASTGQKAEGEAALAVVNRLTGVPEPIQHAIRGMYLSQVKETDKALAELQLAVAGDPKNERIWRSLLLAQLNAGKVPDAVAVAQSAQARAAMPGEGVRQVLEKLGAGSPLLKDKDVVAYLLECLTTPGAERGITDVVAALQAGGADVRKLAEAMHVAADRYPEAVELQVLAVRKLMGGGLMDDALAVSRRAMLHDATAAQPAMLMTLCLADMARWEETLTAARKWKSLSPGSADPDVVIAATYLKLAQPAEAVRTLQPLLDQIIKAKAAGQPENRGVVNLYATAQMQMGRTKQVRDLIWPLVEADKSWREDFAHLATDYVKKADQPLAESWLKLLADSTKDGDLEGHMILAVAWGRLGKNLGSDEAKQEAYRLSIAAVDIASSPADLRARAAVVAGGMLGEINDPAHAEELYRKALTLDPKLHQAANNLALVLVKLYHPEEAEAMARQAIGLAPAMATYYDTLAAVLKAEKKWDEALAAEEQAIAREPRNPEWLIAKGEIQVAAAVAAGKKPDVSDVRARISQLRLDFSHYPELKQRYDGLPK